MTTVNNCGSVENEDESTVSLVINKVPIDDPAVTVDENGINISKMKFVYTSKASVVITPDGYYFYHDPVTWAHLVGPYATEQQAEEEFMSMLPEVPETFLDYFDVDCPYYLELSDNVR